MKGENRVKKYPNPCCRCGFCCLAETCPVGQDIYQVSKHKACPGLSFETDKAICEVLTILADWNITGEDAKEVMGIGKGCCIKARAFVGPTAYDFAGLPTSTKTGLVRKIREERTKHETGN